MSERRCVTVGVSSGCLTVLCCVPFDFAFSSSNWTQAVGGTADYFPDGQGGKPWNNKDEHAVNAFWNAKGQWSVRAGA